jgi:hypothetical protein
VKALLDAKADVNAITTDGKTALAAAGEHADLKALLVQAGATR